MLVNQLCQELGVKYVDMRKGIMPVAENLGISIRMFRPMSKLTDQVVEDIRFIFKDKANPDYTFVTPQDEPIGRDEVPPPPMAVQATTEAETMAPPAVKKPATTPWRPAKLLEIPERYKDKGFRYRWCDKDKPGNIRKKESEGWEIDRKISQKMNAALSPTLEDGKPVDSTSRIRELVVMRMPVERAEARNKYYQDRNEAQTKQKGNEFAGEINNIGGRAYGNIEERREA